MKSSKNIFENTLFNKSIIALVILLIAILILLSYANLTNRESALLGTVLTFISILAGGLISHAYSQQANENAINEMTDYHQKNLRTYALKAAEKVNNLSKELTRLSSYLSEELEETDYRSVEEELLAKEERIQSSIHMLDTLRSVNDTSLSDWRGVIGDELNEQEAQQAERTEELNELVDKLSVLEASHLDVQKKIDAITLQEELQELRKGLRALAKNVTGVQIKSNFERGYVLLTEKCPSCDSIIAYRQKPRKNNPKAVVCTNCNINLLSEYTEEHGFKLRIRKIIPEDVICPSCSHEMNIELDEWPSASASVKCTDCEETFRISRASGELKINIVHQLRAKYPVTEEVLNSVKNAMPSQPWPKHIHKKVADEIGLPPQQVQRAIQQLIRNGVFQDQIDGEICTTAEKLAILRNAGEDL